jgi:hypothetical protein
MNDAILIRRPLVSVNTAMAALDKTEDEVLALCEEGRLTAFNIAARGSRSRELRILTASIGDVEQGRPARDPLEKTEWERIIDAILPSRAQTPSAVYLARRFNCGSEHIKNLVKGGSLHRVGKLGRPGPHGSQKILRASVTAFFERRVVL